MDSEQNPLLASEGTRNEEKVDLPPPPYQPEVPKEDVLVPPPSYPKSMPLPTYIQSEKYEKEGVLDLNEQGATLDINSDDDDDDEYSDEADTTQREIDNRGTCCEFAIFFLVTLLFSVVGFIFAICLATTAASQGGALAGLGVAFLAKPFIFEFYDKQHMQEYVYSATCKGCNDVERCQTYVFHAMRLFFWIVGFIGFALLYKGVSKFLSTRKSRRATTDD